MQGWLGTVVFSSNNLRHWHARWTFFQWSLLSHSMIRATFVCPHNTCNNQPYNEPIAANEWLSIYHSIIHYNRQPEFVGSASYQSLIADRLWYYLLVIYVINYLSSTWHRWCYLQHPLIILHPDMYTIIVMTYSYLFHRYHCHLH